MRPTTQFLRVVMRDFAACLLMPLGLTVFAAAPPEKLDVIVTPAGTFSNVTVVSLTATHVTLRSAKGAIATVKLVDLTAATQARLKGQTPLTSITPSNAITMSAPRPPAAEAATNAPAVTLGLERSRAVVADWLRRFSPTELGAAMFGVVLGVWLLFWGFYCYCLRLICVKAGNDPGVLIWLPVLQAFPMLHAAGMSSGWFLALLIPFLNLIASIVWCFKITQARGKPGIVGLLLILPVTNILAFLYLAFSGVEEPEERVPSPASTPLSFA